MCTKLAPGAPSSLLLTATDNCGDQPTAFTCMMNPEALGYGGSRHYSIIVCKARLSPAFLGKCPVGMGLPFLLYLWVCFCHFFCSCGCMFAMSSVPVAVCPPFLHPSSPLIRFRPELLRLWQEVITHRLKSLKKYL